MSHVNATADLSERNVELGSTGSVPAAACLAVGVIGLAIAFLFPILSIGDTSWDSFWRSWLQTWIFVLQIPLGAFFFVFIQHLTRAGWSVAVRRPAEVIASNLNWLWIGFLPIAALFFTGDSFALFPWSDMSALAAVAPEEAHLVEGKAAYLNMPFFMVRAVIYFIVWAVLANYFLRGSIRQGHEHGDKATLAMQKVSAPAAILFGLTTTFAAFDWIMTLSPAWFSTMFGVYFFAGCATCGFSGIIVTCILLQRSGRMVDLITNEHYQDMGKLLFGLGMVFWAYIGFSQYMLIWYANIPEETGWFLARQFGGWGWFSAWLLFGHFCIPFVFLISKHPKRNWRTLVFAAVWMLFFGWFDMYWLVMPIIPHDLATFTTYDAASEAYAHVGTGLLNPPNWFLLAGMLGIFSWITIARLRSHPLICKSDPWIKDSLTFENM
jgi:hypothetical protein